MPNYTYICDNCRCDFEIFFYIKDYQETPKCISCNSKKTRRNYIVDALSQSASVKKADSELKTIGDLALRNSEKMSDDQKISLYQKHNEYKENKEETKPLPSGMSRLKKPQKPIWPGASGKKRRQTRK